MAFLSPVLLACLFVSLSKWGMDNLNYVPGWWSVLWALTIISVFNLYLWLTLLQMRVINMLLAVPTDFKNPHSKAAMGGSLVDYDFRILLSILKEEEANVRSRDGKKPG